MQERALSWKAHEIGATEKTSAWYWTVGIIAGGAAVASFIIGNVLLGLMAIIGAFAIMLAGSQPGAQRSYAISDSGIHLGSNLIPFSNIKRFAIHEDVEPKRLTLATASLMGTISIPLDGVDFRAVRSELKNRNIEETDEIGSLGEKIAEAIGM